MRPLLASFTLMAALAVPLTSSAQGLGDVAKREHKARDKNAQKPPAQLISGTRPVESRTAVPQSAGLQPPKAESTSTQTGSSTAGTTQARSTTTTPSAPASKPRVYTGEDLLLGRESSAAARKGTFSHPGGEALAPSPESDAGTVTDADANAPASDPTNSTNMAASAKGGTRGRPRPTPTPTPSPTPTPAPTPGPTPAPTPTPTPTPSPTPAPGDDYFISPSGNDSNDGRSQASPFRTFARAFSVMPGGARLFLLDGVYSSAAGTGTIHYSGTGSGQPPSGIASQPTQVRALNPGRVSVGPLFLGRSTRKDSYIYIAGITFQGGGQLYNTSYVTVKDCGFHGPFGIGTNDHAMGNSRNLIEDVWIWTAGERIIAINYRAHENVWRRVVVRGDGCGTSACQGSGNPNVGITVYDSHDVSMQNVMVVDRILAPGDSPYSDFACAQHTADPQYYLGRAEWLGIISLNSPDTGFYCEPDYVIAPTVSVVDAVAWNARDDGFNLSRRGSVTLRNLTSKAFGGDAVRVAPELTSGTVLNVLVAGFGRYGVNSSITPSYVNVHGTGGAPYNQTSCGQGCYSQDPVAGGSLKYITRIEPGSFLKGRGASGGDIGANVVNRYGQDGARFGESGYSAFTSTPLWPWPNEVRLRQEMCGDSGVTRGFCSASSLTEYVWGYLGNPAPAQ